MQKLTPCSQYTALSNLDAATYQTTYQVRSTSTRRAASSSALTPLHLQLKLLTTALFSLLFFRRSLSLTKWFSLFLLTAGVAIVQLDTSPSSASSTKAANIHPQDPRLGLAAILAACISSGLAGGWFEWVLKSPSAPAPSPTPSTPSTSTGTSSAPGTPVSASSPSTPQLRANSPSLWARNLQLSVPSLVFSLSGVFLSPQLQLSDGFSVAKVWMGFTPLVWGVVLNQALGGLLVAMVS